MVRPPTLAVASSEPWRGQRPSARDLAKTLRPGYRAEQLLDVLRRVEGVRHVEWEH